MDPLAQWLTAEREAWDKRPNAGMVEFDEAYLQARIRGTSERAAQLYAMRATLDAFVEQLKMTSGIANL